MKNSSECCTEQFCEVILLVLFSYLYKFRIMLNGTFPCKHPQVGISGKLNSS